MDQKTFLIFGISKGLGKAIAQQLPKHNDMVFGISRSKPSYLDNHTNVNWISADLSQSKLAVETLKASINQQKIDYFIYNVGIWENNAFTNDYNFENSLQEEIINLVNTNITSCILMIQAMLGNLKLSQNAKIILIGSTWGLDNHNGKEVAFSASKFALRGIIHSLRENLRAYNIGVSILNLGYLATDYDYDDNTEALVAETKNTLIPLPDVIQALRFIISTSSASCIKEINMPAMQDQNL